MRAALELRIVLLDPPDLSADDLEREAQWLIKESLQQRLGAADVTVRRMEVTG